MAEENIIGMKGLLRQLCELGTREWEKLSALKVCCQGSYASALPIFVRQERSDMPASLAISSVVLLPATVAGTVVRVAMRPRHHLMRQQLLHVEQLLLE